MGHNELSVETFLKQAEAWSRKDILQAAKGLRDLQMRWDNKRQLKHVIYDGQTTAEVQVDLDDTEKASVAITTAGYDPSNDFLGNHSSVYFTLSKQQLKDLGTFVYFSALDPEENITPRDTK